MPTRKIRVAGGCTGQVARVNIASPAPSRINSAPPTMPGASSPASRTTSTTTNAVVALVRASLRSSREGGGGFTMITPAMRTLTGGPFNRCS